MQITRGEVLLLGLALGLQSCSSPESPDKSSGPSLAHRVVVPARYQWGNSGWPYAASLIQLYVSSYEAGWRKCVVNYATSIDHRTTLGDTAGSGWPSAVDGFYSGYRDAEARIRQGIREFGVERMTAFLAEVVSGI